MGQQLTVIEEKRERPFSCGTQYADWAGASCDRCTKNTPPEDGDPRCEIQHAIFESMFADGTVSPEIARRMGYTDPRQYVWQCDEWEPTEAWKAEHQRRQTWNYRIRRWWWRTKRAAKKWANEKIRKSREKWRMPQADRHFAPATPGCFADWCLWAISFSEEKPDRHDKAMRCQQDAKESGSCYCGKFQCEKKADEGQN